jgi:hypothetical protein
MRAVNRGTPLARTAPPAALEAPHAQIGRQASRYA